MKYYLFIIKSDYYRKNDFYLYSMLENLKYLSSENYNYGFSLYHSICYFFNCSILDNYISKKYNLKKVNNKYNLSSDTYFEVNRSYCLIKTSNLRYLRQIMCIFYIYHKDIFVCNFDNKEYFWLKDKFN